MQDPELVNQLKERLPEGLFEKLNDSLSIDRDRLRFAEYKVRVLEERLRLVRIEKYGPGSEKLSEAQLDCWSWSLVSAAPKWKPKVSASNCNCHLTRRMLSSALLCFSLGVMSCFAEPQELKL